MLRCTSADCSRVQRRHGDLLLVPIGAGDVALLAVFTALRKSTRCRSGDSQGSAHPERLPWRPAKLRVVLAVRAPRWCGGGVSLLALLAEEG